MTHQDHPVADYEAVLTEGAQFIDVREPDEFAGGSLPGATNMPLSDFFDLAKQLDPTRRVVALCKSGGRSTNALEHLAASGFTDLVNLDGGMMGIQASAAKERDSIS